MQYSLTSDIIQQMQQLVGPGSPEPRDPEILAQLRSLTQALIQSYQKAGRLRGDPFQEARDRQLHLYSREAQRQLHRKTVLVTGGEGCVGGHLIRKLQELGVDRIISVDKVRCGQDAAPIVTPHVTFYAADIRDYDRLVPIFATEQPEIVFHLAAQRLPGLAETLIHETITSNIFGTQNIIQLCEAFGVQQCVFSSTGKASRYLTAEVYAASKKMAEWLFAAAARRGTVRYGMVRFTHMLENSAMCEQIEAKVRQGRPVNIHAPDRYVAGQNVGEAVHLLLNALVLAEPGRLQFSLVRHLGWPTESLEVALYQIMQSAKALPIYFQGVLPGYEESFFLGQVDWDDQIDINTLINALETAHHSSVSASGDMIVAELVPFSTSVLHTQLEQLRSLSLSASPSSVPQTELKRALAEAVREVTRSTFLLTPPQRLLRILKWGVNSKQFYRGELKLEAFQDILELLLQSLQLRLTADLLHHSSLPLPEVQEILEILETLPALRQTVARLQVLLQTATAPMPSLHLRHLVEPELVEPEKSCGAVAIVSPDRGTLGEINRFANELPPVLEVVHERKPYPHRDL